MKFLQKAKDLRRYGQHLFAVYVSVLLDQVGGNCGGH